MTSKDQKMIRLHVIRQRIKGIALAAVTLGVLLTLFGQIIAAKQASENSRVQLQALNDSQKKTVSEVVTQTDLLREQGNLIVCLLQLASPDGNFTDRQECQRRANEAQQRLRSGKDPVTSPNENEQGNPQGSATAPATPAPICISVLCIKNP